jgi:site-specific recombinase XerD
MDEIAPSTLLADPETRRALQLDALSAILPIDRRDRLAQLLTDDDVETLKHLAREGIGENTLKALASDLGYLEGWALVATGSALPWPAPEALALKFVAHHLWDPAQREADPNRGMPDRVTETLRAERLLVTIGPHVPNTVRRRLSSWATLHHWKGGPFASPHLRAAIRLSVRAAARPRTRRSKRAVTRDVLEQALASCAGDRLVDLRDRALLLLAFASGGRRRSEVSRLKVEQLTDEPPVPRDPADPTAGKMPCLSITLGRSKTAQADDDQRVLLIGTPVEVLRAWQERAGISRGFLFRAIDRWGNLEKRALAPQSVNLIVKRRLDEAGLDPKEFSAHGLRSGYLTEASRRGVPLPEAMQQSQHRSVQQAASYYNDAERRLGRAARSIE